MKVTSEFALLLYNIETLPNRFYYLPEIEYLVALYYPQDQYNNIGNVRVSEKQKEMS